MSVNEQLQVPADLGSFESEVERYKPKDMIDFCIEYFKCLQSGTPLDYKNLSGLEKFELKPEDMEVAARLGIPVEDLVRVTNRRKIQSKEEILNQLSKNIETFSKINPTNEEEMKKYRKFKTNSFKNNEFLRFIENLENLTPANDEKRIYFTKVFNLSEKEKQIIFDLIECDINLEKKQKLKEWKFTLERLENSQKHSYHNYDNISNKLEQMLLQLENKEKIDEVELEEISKEYTKKYFEKMKYMNENELYNFLITKQQFERIILYQIVKIKYIISENRATFQKLHEYITNIYDKHFSLLTQYDFYNYVLSCFIPLIKASNKTSNEHREMESFLNKFMSEIPKIININFYEEKTLYYNIECVKYFLNKKNKVLESKQILIDIIKMICKNINYLLKNLKVPIKHLKCQFELVYLILNEFYKDIVLFIEKILSIFDKREIEDSQNILSSLIMQYKSYSKIDQNLITTTLKLYEFFENNREKKNKIDNLGNILLQSLSVPELAFEIQKLSSSSDNLISTFSNSYYLSSIKQPKYNFTNLHYINLRAQSEVISLIIKNNPNIKNTALIYEKEQIAPVVKYDFIIEEIYKFTNLYYKLIFDKEMKEQVDKDAKKLIDKVIQNFKEEYSYIKNDDKNGVNDYDIEKFKSFNNFQQKLILTFMNFLDDYNLTNFYADIIEKLSFLYLAPKVEYIKAKILKEKDIENNKIFIDFIYDEIKRVNPRIYIFLQYDQTIEFLATFSVDLQKVIQNIMQAEKCQPSITLPSVIPVKDMMEESDMNAINVQLQENYQLMNDFILDYNFEKPEDLIIDFDIFPIEYKKFIIFYLQKVKQKVPLLKENLEKYQDDLGFFDYKKIIKCESDPEANDEIKKFYRKQLLKQEQKLSGSKINFISCILDYPYDPNNNYLYKNFLSFYPKERIIILQDILSRMKILDYHTLYYENLVCQVMPEIIKEQIGIANRHQESKVYYEYLNKEFLYLISFFNDSVLKFVKEILYADYQAIYRFTNEFSDKERGMIVQFMELFSVLTKNKRYPSIKDTLQNYLIDLSYEERIKDINDKLDMVVKNEVHKDLFMVVSEEIKESFYEINYLIEQICINIQNLEIPPEEQENNSFLFMIYKSLSVGQRDIVEKVLLCISEQKYEKNMKFYQDELALMKNTEQGQSIFSFIKKSFEEIKEKIKTVEGEEKEAIKEKYNTLKSTLYGICGDLFNFSDNCAKGNVSLRKIKAISHEKRDIIKTILECEYNLYKEPKLKVSFDYIKQLKFE